MRVIRKVEEGGNGERAERRRTGKRVTPPPTIQTMRLEGERRTNAEKRRVDIY